MALPSRSPVTWWQTVLIWLCVIKHIRLAFDSNRNIFTLQSHKNSCAFFRFVQTSHFLHAVMPPGGKTYQADFDTFSSTEDKSRDLEDCFIATSTLYDWRGIQIYIFVENFNTKTRIL